MKGHGVVWCECKGPGSSELPLCPRADRVLEDGLHTSKRLASHRIVTSSHVVTSDGARGSVVDFCERTLAGINWLHNPHRRYITQLQFCASAGFKGCPRPHERASGTPGQLACG